MSETPSLCSFNNSRIVIRSRFNSIIAVSNESYLNAKYRHHFFQWRRIDRLRCFQTPATSTSERVDAFTSQHKIALTDDNDHRFAAGSDSEISRDHRIDLGSDLLVTDLTGDLLTKELLQKGPKFTLSAAYNEDIHEKILVSFCRYAYQYRWQSFMKDHPKVSNSISKYPWESNLKTSCSLFLQSK